MQSFEPTKNQIDALENGATKLWIPIEKEKIILDESLFDSQSLIVQHSPLQKGEEYIVKENLYHMPMTLTSIYGEKTEIINPIIKNTVKTEIVE